MRVLIAPHSFGGTLTASQAAEAIAAGWGQRAPADELILRPVGDGGPGFLDVISAALAGRGQSSQTLSVVVRDPLGRPTPSQVLVAGEERPEVAYVEASQAAGLHLLGASEREPGRASSYGVGELLEAAFASGAPRIVVGIGGTATNDAGAGMLAALGAGPPELLAGGGEALAAVDPGDLAGLREVRARFARVTVDVASSTTAPLLGFQGASAVYAPLKGATPAQAQQLEGALSRFAEVCRTVLPGPAELTQGERLRLDRLPGAGAGGGIGYALLLLGAQVIGGTPAILEASEFDAALSGSHLVVTGQGKLTWGGLAHTPVAHVGRAAMARGIPTVVLAGQLDVTRRDLIELGVSGAHPLGRTDEEQQASLLDPVGALTAAASRVAGSWSTSVR